MSDKTTDPEAEYFARLDKEKKAALAEELSSERVRADKEERARLHHLR